MRKTVLVPILLLLVIGSPAAQAPLFPAAVRAAADSITADQLKRDLDFLASDALMGRNTPSAGFDTAAKHIAGRLAKAGVRPLGDNGTFFQHYQMREIRVDTSAAHLEIGGRRFGFGSDFGIRSFAGPVSGTYPVVYVGHGWVLPGRNIDAFGSLDVNGKVVVAHGPRALPRGVDIAGGRVTPAASGVLPEAARRGAVAVVFIPLKSALENWEQSRGNSITRREMEPAVPSAYGAPRTTSLLVSAAATEALFAGEKIAGSELMSRGDAADYPDSFELTKKVTLNIPAAADVLHRPYNVVGLIEGSDPALKNEYITIESHLDGAVGTRAVDGDAIYNSADDNATGSAANLAIAERMMKAPRPRRSLVFIWDSGEEQGLWGTRYFVGNPPVPLSQIVAHFNIDMIGGTRAPGSPDEKSTQVTGPREVYLVGPGVLSATADALLTQVNAAYLNLEFNRAYDRPDHEFFYPRTDAGPFLERGILTIGFFTGLHPRYHQPSDEARYLDPKKMEDVTRTVFVSVWTLANAAERPRIDKGIPETVPQYR